MKVYNTENSYETIVPVVSIIMPVFNASKYIEEAVSSILMQDYENWELIIIDDGSTDDSLNIVSTFYEDRIVIIKQTNKGVSAARNIGLNIAKGKYITFLDADDILTINSINIRVQYLESNNHIDIVDGNINIMDSKIQEVKRTYKPYYNGLLLPKLLKLDSRVFFGVVYMLKREIIGDTRFNEKIKCSEDLLFYTEISSKSQVNYSYVPEVIYCYRTGHVSAMTNLKSLENGYKELIRYVDSLKIVSYYSKLLFKLKIKKIMFLSWFDQKKYFQAIKSLINLSKI